MRLPGLLARGFLTTAALLDTCISPAAAAPDDNDAAMMDVVASIFAFSTVLDPRAIAEEELEAVPEGCDDGTSIG